MMLSYTAVGLLQLITVLRYPTDLDWSRAAAVVYVCFLATLLLGGYGWWRPSTRGRQPADNLLANVKVVATGCMEACLADPALPVAPTTSGMPGSLRPTSDPVEQHLIGEKPVEMLRIGPEDFCA